MTGPNSLTLNDGKAGMEGLDKERINKIIREASKGSKFFQHAEKKEKELKCKVDKMLQERKALSDQVIKQSEIELDALLARLESTRDVSRDIVHVDMDAFYAAVEMRDNPALKDVPMAVGGSSMLSTSNYLARRYGVRAAMPGFIAKKLCPDLVIVPGNHEKYSAVSSQVMDVIGKYTTEFSAMSLDEVYCDMTDLVQNRTVPSALCPEHGNPETVESTTPGDPPATAQSGFEKDLEHSGKSESSDESARHCWCRRESVVWNVVAELRRDIELATQLTASAGLSCNTFLAKVCSDLNKPNGQYLLHSDRETVMDFVAQLDIKKLASLNFLLCETQENTASQVPGIGRVQQAYLSALEINKVSDLISQRGVLAHLFTAGTVQFYLATALGLGSNQVSSEEGKCKSMSTENTFSDMDVNDENNKLTPEIKEMLAELSATLANRLKAENLAGETISIKLKLATFEILQRSRTQTHAVSSKEDIEMIARDLLSSLLREKLENRPSGYRLSARLLGVRVNKFVTSTKQSSLLSFTRSSTSSPTKTWICPVCEASLPAQIVSFNRHVDICVGTDNQSNHVTQHDSVNPEEDWSGDITKPSLLADRDAPDKLEKNIVSRSDQGNLGDKENSGYSFPDKRKDNYLEHRGQKRKSVEAQSNGEIEKWACPVCNKALSSNLATFNLHIDRCLAKGEDSSASKDQSYGPVGPAKKQRTVSNTSKTDSSEASRAVTHKQSESLFRYFKRA